MAETNTIPEIRKTELKQLAGFIERQLQDKKIPQLIFICTHNSRRSHLSQIWAHAAAYFYGIPEVTTFSGGTEATAFNYRAVAAVGNAGFQIEKTTDGDNPVYLVRYAADAHPLKCFSKKYSDPFNPQDNFCAIMTCSDADEACPIVFGAAERITIRYNDPKAFDDTEQETEKYDERCRQIAREMLFAFSQITVPQNKKE
ncbi:MAG TPA: protein-tyrosine-phosphatase [Calditrichia bacterium]|nr:protein-tyrosine-phosphatase [Calditrichia bacterium]